MPADTAIQDLIAAWLADLEREGKSRHTVAAYRRAVEHFIHWNNDIVGANFDVEKIIPRDVRDWKAWQQAAEKAAPATINQRLAGLSGFYDWAHQAGHADDDPTQGISSLRLPPREPQALSAADLRRLLREAKAAGARDYAIVEMLAGTGLRVGELLALEVGDVELNERSGKVTVRRGKREGYREVPLTRDVRKALEGHLAEHPEPDNPEAPLWWGTRGPLSHRSSVMRALKRIAHKAGIEDVSPHALRHTFATRYLDANPGDLRGLARLLGHASLNTVMIYTEPDMNDLADRLERMERGG
jgi:site-specific recombinase XerC